MGNSLEFDNVPSRIISLVPSQTEYLYYLGIIPIAQTIFCIHPKDEFAKATKIGGTKKLNLEKIEALQPDLIIGNKEENVQEEIEHLQTKFPVWMSDVNSLSDGLDMILRLGQLLGKSQKSINLKLSIQAAFNRLNHDRLPKLSVLYFIWRSPYYAVGNTTFIHDMLEQCGFVNALGDQSRYPELTEEEIQRINPGIVFLSSEPFPFKEEHKHELQSILPHSKIVLVDGEMFSWYGNRMLKTPEYVQQLVLSS